MAVQTYSIQLKYYLRCENKAIYVTRYIKTICAFMCVDKDKNDNIIHNFAEPILV